MKFYHYICITSLIASFLLQFGCKSNQNKWKAVPLQIKKQESYNYSEVISGKLDSTEKAGLEEVRKNVSEKNTNLSTQLDELRSETKSSFLKTIWKSTKNIYYWFLDLF